MKKIPVSTASTIHGVNITETFGFVSSHVIAGTNLFSDIFAIFSDTFGGRSKTYKKQLTAIKAEAVQELMDEAIRAGGNAIVGMSIDLDEVSGGGKSMFMITASGTSVKIENNSASSILQNNNEVDNNELDSLIFKAKIIASAKNDTLKLSEKDFGRVIEDGIFEITDYIINWLYDGIGNYSGDFESFKEQVKVYFSLMPREVAIEKIYSDIIQGERSSNFILGIIKDNYLFDYQNIKLLLQSEQLLNKKTALNIINYEKPSYTIDDIDKQQKLIDLIDSNIKPISEIYEVKTLLGTKNVWKCLCETKINEGDRLCHICQTDIYGFKTNEVNDAKIKLSNRIIGLKTAFPTT
jgi:uncharacterized protein YbjQ (UPF0145 family)